MYYGRCQIVLTEVEEADAIVLDMKATPAGIIRVNAPVTFGTHALSPFITRYLGDYPEVEVELTLSDRIVNPAEENVEVIIRIGELTDSAMVAWPLCRIRSSPAPPPPILLGEDLPKYRPISIIMTVWSTDSGRHPYPVAGFFPKRAGKRK